MTPAITIDPATLDAETWGEGLIAAEQISEQVIITTRHTDRPYNDFYEIAAYDLSDALPRELYSTMVDTDYAGMTYHGNIRGMGPVITAERLQAAGRVLTLAGELVERLNHSMPDAGPVTSDDQNFGGGDD